MDIDSRLPLFADRLLGGERATEAAKATGIELLACKGLSGFYVYLLIDPRDDTVFYVGKGTARRAFAHATDCKRGNVVNTDKHNAIRAILDAGLDVVVRAIAHGLEENAAYALERKLIELLPDLTNGGSAHGLKWALAAQRELKKIPSYCVWEFNVLPRMCTELAAEENTALYWDIIADYQSIVRSVSGRPRSQHLPSMFELV